MTRTARHSAEAEGQKAFRNVAVLLAEIGREFHGRGWALGTSGNFSAVVSRKPLRLAITPTGIDKGRLAASAIIETGDGTRTRNRSGRSLKSQLKSQMSEEKTSEKASAETLLHFAVARVRGAGAVLHTHSVWGTVLSEECAAQGGISIAGYEMLKGLAGVRTHKHREWLPILDNGQDMADLAKSVERTLEKHPAAHGFLLQGHGLYTWGRDLAEAKRHVEILEFLLEVVGRRLSVLSVPSVPSVLSVGNSGRFKSLGKARKAV